MKDLSNNRHFRKRLASTSTSYSEASQACREVGDCLFERIDTIKFKPKKILDLGGGDGYFCEKLKQRFPKAQVINLDLSYERLAAHQPTKGFFHKTPYQSVCADMQNLPFAKDSFDMVFANLSFQNCNLEKLFSEIARVLDEGGVLLFAMLGPDSLIELRQAFAQIDEKPHVNIFPDMHDLGDRLLAEQLQGPVMDVENGSLSCDSVSSLIKKLAQWGERNHHPDRSQHLMTPRKWEQMLAAYPKNDDGTVTASFEIVFGHAWGRRITQSMSRDGTVFVSIDSLRKRP